MNDSTRSNTGLGVPHISGEDAFHPQLDGYTLVMTGPLPPFLRGGFGRVYRAMNSDGALMAVKVPHPSTLSAPTLQRWNDECRLSLALPPHEHVVTFFGRTTARWPDGRESPALVMEWLEGARPLISYADAVGLDKPQRVELLMQAIEGVAWMHEHGTPHCDLKSTNMLVIDRGRRAVVKITDFGGTRGRSGLDPRPAVFSLHRVAPEVLAGDPAAIDARADVFALGKELAELVAGPDATRAPVGDHRAWRPSPVRAQRGLDDPALDAIIVKATQVEPSQRFANAVEMLEALRQYAPPLSERLTMRVDHWLRPHRTERWPTRATRAAFALTALFMFGAVYLCHLMLSAGLGPVLTIAARSPDTPTRVSIFRAMDSGAMGRIAERQGIDGVSELVPATNRRVWARAIDRLVESGAAAITLDILFPSNPDPTLNTVMGDAIARARSKGVPVVVAVDDYQPGSADRHAGDFRIASEIVRAGALWGCLRLEPVIGLNYCLLVPRSSSGEVRPPLAIASVAAVLGDPPPTRPVLDAADGVLRFPGEGDRGRSILLSAVKSREDASAPALPGLSAQDLIGIYPIGLPPDASFTAIDRPIEDLWATDESTAADVRELVRGRIVFLAAHSPEDIVEITPGRVVPGVRVHAAVADAMLQQIDAPSLGLQRLLPVLISVPAGAIGAGVMMMLAARRAGLAVPGHERTPNARAVPATVAVRRWRLMVLMVAAAVVACAFAWIAAPRIAHFTLPYEVGQAVLGVASGMLLGALIVIGRTWMGVVRRAWRCAPEASTAIVASR